jgi:hypothetical protein
MASLVSATSTTAIATDVACPRPVADAASHAPISIAPGPTRG